MKRFTLPLIAAAATLLTSLPLHAAPPPDTAALAAKIIVPKVDFRDSTLRESLEFLAARGLALDPAELGINIIIKAPVNPPPPVPVVPSVIAPPDPANPPPPPAVPAVPAAPPNSVNHLTLTLNNVPLSEVVKYIAKLTDSTLRWDPNAVVVLAPVDGKAPPEKPRPAVPIADGLDMEKVVKPLQQAKLPKVDFRETTVTETLEFLSQKARALLPGGKGLNIVLKADAAKDRKLTFTARNISLIDVLRYTAELADLELSIEEFAVVFSDPKAK